MQDADSETKLVERELTLWCMGKYPSRAAARKAAKEQLESERLKHIAANFEKAPAVVMPDTGSG